MKKITCSKVQTLSPEDLDQVVGGFDPRDKYEYSNKINETVGRVLGGGRWGGSGTNAGDIKKGNDMNKNSDVRTGGCNTRANDRDRDSGRSSRVICTHFYRKGMLDRAVWRADLEFTELKLSKTTVRGYHYWAIPYVELMRKHAFFEKIMFPIAKYRAIELAYQMNVVEKGSLRGKLIRLVIEPTCFAIGLFCEQKDWKKLWAN